MSSSQNTQYHNAVGTLPNTDILSQFPVPTPSCGKGQVLVKNEMLGLAAMSTWMVRPTPPALEETLTETNPLSLRWTSDISLPRRRSWSSRAM